MRPTSTARLMSALLLCGPVAGCYLAHERPLPGTDAGPVGAPVDALVDASSADVVPVEPIERRIPGVLPHLGWDGDEVAVVVLPHPSEPRVLHRFSPALDHAAPPVVLGEALLGGVAWRADRIGSCNLALPESTLREHSLDGATVMSERPMHCTAIAAWGDAWATTVLDPATDDLTLARDGEGGVTLGPHGHPVQIEASLAIADGDAVLAHITPELDVVLVRMAPDGSLRAQHRLFGIAAWYVALAAAPDGSLALLVDTSVSRNTLELLRLGDDLVPLGEPVVIAREHEGGDPPRLAAFDGGWAALWVAMDWTGGTLGPVRLAWLDRTGGPIGETQVLAGEVVYGSLALLIHDGAAYVVHDDTTSATHPELLLRRMPTPR